MLEIMILMSSQTALLVLKMDKIIGTEQKRRACEAAPLAMQCSAVRSLFFSRPWRTDFTDGLWINCRTNRCDCKTTTAEHHRRPADVHQPIVRLIYSHSSRRSLLSGLCCGPADTRVSGAGVCGKFFHCVRW